MPKLEPKIVQREIEQNQLWPVYWIYGSEKMKSRELLKRIRKAALGDETKGFGLGEETFDGSETSAETIVDAAKSPALGGGLRLIVVRDAHAIKAPEAIAELFAGKNAPEKLGSVCVFLSKDLDARKKFSKQLIELAAVVQCEEIAENEREAWIQYLSKRRGIALPPEAIANLTTLDPWTLDIVDQELEKFAINSDLDGLLQGAGSSRSQQFLDAFFSRDLKKSLECAETFADQPEESLPLLGLLSWNVRQLALKNTKLNPYLAEKLTRWSRNWKIQELVDLQEALAEIDFSLKQTPRIPLGMWDSLVMKFCR